MRLWQMYVCVLLLAAAVIGAAMLAQPSKKASAWAECKNPRDSMAASICAEMR